MTSLIVCPSSRGYIGAMAVALLRLLALAALILMPFGMVAGPARAELPTAHAMAGKAGKGHCGEQNDSKSGKMLGMHCAGSCSALPQTVAHPTVTVSIVEAIHIARSVERLAGLMPVPSTPPPKIA